MRLEDRDRHTGLGERILQGFRAQLEGAEYISEIRGKGLMVGIELDQPARPFCEALFSKGVLCKETHDKVIRFAPPLVVSEADLDWALDQLIEVLSA